MSKFLYNIFLLFHFIGLRLAGFWSLKARLWVKGRQNLFTTIESKLKNNNSPVIWMHCASFGEFEQGRPLLEQLKLKHPGYSIVLTFFSPSGYETVTKNHPSCADYIFYLPMDSVLNAKKLVRILKPTLALWVKYEFWYYHLAELKKQNIPVLLTSAIFREDQLFFKWYGRFGRKMLQSFSHFFVQNNESKELLNSIGFTNNVTISGDTRFDRVIDIAANHEALPLIEIFCSNNKVIVAGSTWEDDEAELNHYAKTHPEIKFIIAPHEIDEENLQNVEKEFPNAIRYSQLAEKLPGVTAEGSANCLIIDNIGMLSKLYYYAHVTYVGGGFGDGIHNVLEAAVYGKPVIHGPQYKKYFEAVELIECGADICISNALEAEKILDELFNNPEELRRRSKLAKEYVYSKAGSTNKIIEFIQANRLLTN